MKLNSTLFAHMRNATRSLFHKGPIDTAKVIQTALQNAAALQQAAQQAQQQGAQPPMRDINPPPGGAANEPQATHAGSAHTGAQSPADMLANLSRSFEAMRGGFGAAPFDTTPEEPLPGTFRDGSYTNEAGTRSYKLYVPSTYSETQPCGLLVMLHGCTQDPDDFAKGTQMNALAEELHCIVVYPAQCKQANASRCWNWFSAVDQKRDQGEPSIIAGITREIMARHKVDPAQVYVAGLSAGGAMATIMGTLYPDLYAAVGVHSGLPFAAAHDLPSALAAMKGDVRSRRTPKQAIPIIVFHGDKDTTVHPANGDELIAQGARHMARGTAVEPGRVPDGHAYTRTMHHRADGTVHAEHWLIHGAGHAWSGGSARGSYTDGKGPDASREMMRFFRTVR